MDSSQGSIPIPIETDLQFQRAFSPSFDRLPMRMELLVGWLAEELLTVLILIEKVNVILLITKDNTEKRQ